MPEAALILPSCTTEVSRHIKSGGEDQSLWSQCRKRSGWGAGTRTIPRIVCRLMATWYWNNRVGCGVNSEAIVDEQPVMKCQPSHSFFFYSSCLFSTIFSCILLRTRYSWTCTCVLHDRKLYILDSFPGPDNPMNEWMGSQGLRFFVLDRQRTREKKPNRAQGACRDDNAHSLCIYSM